MYTRVIMWRARAAAGAAAVVLLFAVPQAVPPAFSQPLQPTDGRVELGLVLRQLNSTGTFLMITAHPDDENNALLALLSKGAGHRAVLLTATRGDGGQNEIGAELFDALAVLRTEELLAAHRLDGAEQYFTRAVDFGYSFSREETFARWGRQEVLGDMVRIIRTVRPDVISAMSPEGQYGGQHHQASAILAREAFAAAADPARFPEQIAAGLRPWQAAKFYFQAGFPFGMGIGPPGFRARVDPDPALTTVDLGGYDALLGRTYAEIGSRARSMHKCQGMSQLVALPSAAAGAQYRLADTTLPGSPPSGETSLFDGIDTTIEGLARLAGANPPAALTRDLAALGRDARAAIQGFEASGMAGARAPLAAGLQAVRGLRSALGGLALASGVAEEIDLRLEAKERQFEQAMLLAHAVRLEVLADDGLVTPGQRLNVAVLAASQGDAGVQVRGVRLAGFDGADASCAAEPLAAGGVYSCERELRIPAGAAATDIHWSHVDGADRYAFDPAAPFGAPFRPTPFRAVFDIELGAAGLAVERPVEYRYASDIFAGEKRMELHVAPRFAVSMTPEVAVVPAGGESSREVRVTVTYAGREAAAADVTLDLPAGWRAQPERASVRFSREDESRTVRFTVSGGSAGVDGDSEHRIRAVVEQAGRRFDRGFQVVEYAHTARRHVGRPAEGAFKVIDVSVAPDLLVGYIVGVGDAVPQAIEQLGVRLELIDADELAWGDLGRFDVIVTGVRAYERRQDLRANNDRLLEYVDNGGVAIVQYNKFEFNQAQYGPLPAQVSRNRVTDEHAPVRVIAQDHPAFGWPNRIGAPAWSGWVQERGLYFLGDRDPAYVDLVELEDSFEWNPGVKRGALVELQHGRGRWLYVGLGLWRQLPAGTPGAYQLLANLLSLGAVE
ncbi:MAG: PIG-L family deacetylase [Acidobacteria bacterium]|nr:PIG-L family deacetylase [Acidobacteriota bacterium]